jgi:hypothetical protein
MTLTGPLVRQIDAFDGETRQMSHSWLYRHAVRLTVAALVASAGTLLYFGFVSVVA